MLLMERAGKETGDRTAAVDGVTRATGRSRQEWFSLLDEWEAVGRPYREIADWLRREQGISAWWAQKLIVEYEEARGIRPPGARRDGTFEVGASKVVAAPVGRVFRTLVDRGERDAWLIRAGLTLTEAEPDRSARFDWPDGSSRVAIVLQPKGDRTLVAVRHERLGDARSAAETKTFWRERLEALKALLER